MWTGPAAYPDPSHQLFPIGCIPYRNPQHQILCVVFIHNKMQLFITNFNKRLDRNMEARERTKVLFTINLPWKRNQPQVIRGLMEQYLEIELHRTCYCFPQHLSGSTWHHIHHSPAQKWSPHKTVEEHNKMRIHLCRHIMFDLPVAEHDNEPLHDQEDWSNTAAPFLVAVMIFSVLLPSTCSSDNATAVYVQFKMHIERE